jgi:PKHD-type hydroxylase
LLSACPLRSRQYEDLQLPETAPQARELGDMVMQALGRSELFVSAVLPRHVFPPLFNRYDAGMTFSAAGPHRRVGDAVHIDARGRRRRGARGRGHLWQTQRQAAGRRHDRLSGTSLHNVTPITRGSRIASFFWTQSLIRDDARRALLFDLDMSIRRLSADPRGMRAWSRSSRSTTICCGSGPRCEASGWRAPKRERLPHTSYFSYQI